MLVGVIRRYFVGKSEKEESERLARNEVKTGPFGATDTRLGCTCAMQGLRGLLHLLEPVYDGRMELMFVG